MTDLSGLRNDPQYLSTQQYKDSGNLSSRILIHQKFNTAEQSWYDFTNELMALKPDMRILEVGCGPATLWRMVLNSLHESNRIVLSDFSLGMITEAARTLSKDKRFGFVTMDTMDIAFPSESFDLVIANHMLYHVPSVPQVLDQVAGLLKPGGKFMAATNGAEHMIDLDILLEKFSKKLDQEHAMSSGFNLLNGEKQLREYFANIELHLYSSDLWVTNAKMLTEYAYSTPLVKENLGTEGKTEMSAFFQRRIDHYGGIQIRKQTGVFLARDPF